MVVPPRHWPLPQRLLRAAWTATLVFVVFGTRPSQAQCHHNCNGNGVCDKFARCRCFDGFSGADCSRRDCPKSRAWFDQPTSSNNTAHTMTECGNVGHCDRSTGTCECARGWTGQACSRRSCPNDCSGRGRCLSMAEAAAKFDGFRFNHTAQYTLWDRHVIHGCQCDSGFGGHDCSRSVVSTGADPLTLGRTPEVATMFCQCSTSCNGTFQLTFKGVKSAKLSPSLSNESLGEAFMAMASVTANAEVYRLKPVVVTFDGGTTVCSDVGTTTTFRFNEDLGDQPAIYATHALEATRAPFQVRLHFVTTQTLACTCQAQCGGTFALGYDGLFTDEIPWNATNATVTHRLRALETLARYDVIVNAVANANARAGRGLCEDAASGRTMEVVFRMATGNQPPLQVVSSLTSGGAKSVTSAVTIATNDGAGSDKVCNGHGFADERGECTCDAEFTSSFLGPCGSPRFNTSAWTGLQRCPGALSQADLSVLPVVGATARHLYWANAGGGSPKLGSSHYNVTKANHYNEGLFKANLDATVPGLSMVEFRNLTNGSAAGLALDLSARQLYFADRSRGVVKRLDVDNATNVSVVARGFSANVDGIALDLRAHKRHAYVTDRGRADRADGQLVRFNLDSGDAANEGLWNMTRTIGQSYLRTPTGVALDLVREHIYWLDMANTSTTQDGKLYRSTLSGKAVTLIANNFTDPVGLALDLVNWKAYVTDGNVSTANSFMIKRVSMDYQLHSTNYALGNMTDFETLVRFQTKQSTTYTLGLVWGIFLDPTNEEVWFTDTQRGFVSKVPYAGGTAQVVVHLGSNAFPRGLAFDNGGGYPARYFDCHGHGYCAGLQSNFRCACEDGWFGNCNMSTCPLGPAWFDEAIADDQAHNMVECSNMGTCSRETGKCACHPGFEGEACERSSCPVDPDSGQVCYGHGACVSMREGARLNLSPDGTRSPHEYGGFNVTNTTAWDADRIFGCICDDPGYMGSSVRKIAGWTGFDCSRRVCPTGDDPRTVWEAGTNETVAQTFEVQNITCEANAGSFTLAFRAQTTAAISYNDSAATLQARLHELSSVGRVKVTMSNEDRMCFPDPRSPTWASVKFLTELGDLPSMTATTTALQDSDGGRGRVTIQEAVKGTKENAECAAHGLCNDVSGDCQCFDGFFSSNADGAFGIRGDCGFGQAHNTPR